MVQKSYCFYFKFKYKVNFHKKAYFTKLKKNEEKKKKKDNWQNVSYVSKRHGMSNISPPILEAIVLSKKHHQLFHVLGLPGFEE